MNFPASYWTSPLQLAAYGSPIIKDVAQRILTFAGPGKHLVIGGGVGPLLAELHAAGIDAWGTEELRYPTTEENRVIRTRLTQLFTTGLPYEANSFDYIFCLNVFEFLSTDIIAQTFRELHRVCRHGAYLELHTRQNRASERKTIQGREWWEDQSFRAGFRKHPTYYRVVAYGELDTYPNQIVIPLAKIRHDVFARHPIDVLLKNRTLHMDMSRETGPRSDAHMVRYELAAEWIRPGDRVVDCACGLGYGTAQLAARSTGRHFIGVDLDATAIAYAKDNFGDYFNIDFVCASATELGFIESSSIDCLVSFETLEHLPDYSKFLAEVDRVLKPDGRFIASVPNLWMDHTGKDPNPNHHHVFDYQKLKLAAEAHNLEIEVRYHQTAPGGFKLLDAKRTLERKPLDIIDEDPEWLVIVASSNKAIKNTQGISYCHPIYTTGHTKPLLLVDFAKYYQNPWLYRQLIQIGERCANKDTLGSRIDWALHTCPKDSADYGAALTVLGYTLQTENQSQTIGKFDIFAAQVDEYYSQTIKTTNPHVRRWRISLAYCAATWSMSLGEHNASLAWLDRIHQENALEFSPLIGTKIVSAWFLKGVIHLSHGKTEEAFADFRSGTTETKRLLSALDQRTWGEEDSTFPFVFHEIAEISLWGKRCALAVQWSAIFLHSPGKFWEITMTEKFDNSTHPVSFSPSTALPRGSETIWVETSMLARKVNYYLDRLFGLRIVRSRVLSRIIPHQD